MLLSPPLTMTTSSFASSTIATALSTAACAISKSPFARPARCSSEFAVKSSSTFRRCRGHGRHGGGTGEHLDLHAGLRKRDERQEQRDDCGNTLHGRSSSGAARLSFA